MQIHVWLQRSENHRGAAPDLIISVTEVMDRASMNKTASTNLDDHPDDQLHLHLPRYFLGPVDHAHSELLWNQSRAQAGQDLFVIAMLQGSHHGKWLEFGAGHPTRNSNTYLLEKRFGFSGISVDRVDLSLASETPYEEYWQSLYQAVRQPTWPESAMFHQLDPDQQDYFRETYHYDDFIGMQITDIDSIPRAQRRWHTMRPGTDFHRCDVETEFDFSQLQSHYDYLQIDLDPPHLNIWTLEQVLTRSRFSVITFEHDAWIGTPDAEELRSRSREILFKSGYELMVPNVTIPRSHLAVFNPGVPTNFEDWWVDPQSVDKSVIETYRYHGDEHSEKYYHELLFEKPAHKRS
jgi:hypothetical protein